MSTSANAAFSNTPGKRDGACQNAATKVFAKSVEQLGAGGGGGEI